MIYEKYFKTALYILGVVALGFLALNGFMKFLYNNQLAKAPCDLCKEKNPDVAECLEQKIQVFADALGQFRSPDGRCWDVNGKETECKNVINP